MPRDSSLKCVFISQETKMLWHSASICVFIIPKKRKCFGTPYQIAFLCPPRNENALVLRINMRFYEPKVTKMPWDSASQCVFMSTKKRKCFGAPQHNTFLCSPRYEIPCASTTKRFIMCPKKHVLGLRSKCVMMHPKKRKCAGTSHCSALCG